MPGTVNGFGTRYAGKKNLQQETGLCENCNNVVELQSYETRLFLCALFIPIIPLWKKQIIDYCPKCTYHRAIPVREWEKIRNESLNEGIRKYKKQHRKLVATLHWLEAVKKREPDLFAHWNLNVQTTGQ